MGQKDKKAKAAEQKARVAAKQSKKTAKKEKKHKSKGNEDSDADDEGLESVLEQYAKQQAQFLKVTETPCEPPQPRASATLVASPSNSKELFLFGGEYFNGALATFYNDLFVYHIDRDEWRLITSPNSPLPRSGHAWCRGNNAGGIYLFGGEFSSPKQGTFYHYNDFWRLDPSSREWTRIESKGKGPPARSGHRMTYYKNFIILFGGFQDTSQQTKYLQDLWIYDCQNFVWYNPTPQQKPDPRSSYSLLPHDSGAVLYGGYSRVKANTTTTSKGKGAGTTSKTTMKPMVHQDAWFLRITPLPADAPSKTGPTLRWERRKKPANSPDPARAGATQAFHKGRGLLFGGVHDVEDSEEGIDSEFFNSLLVWNIERNRFFPLNLRQPRTGVPKKSVMDDRDRRGGGGRAKADEAELLRNLAALETKGSIDDAERMEIDTPEKDQDEEEDRAAKPPKPVSMAMPHARFNAQLAVQGDVLYIFGGTYEQGDREFTFADMHTIDIGKLDGVQEIYSRELENWIEEAESESEGDEDEEMGSEDDDLDDEAGPSSTGGGGVALPTSSQDAETKTPMSPSTVATTEGSIDQEIEIESTTTAVTDQRKPHPRPFESLRDFFARTSQEWQKLVLGDSDSQNGKDNSGGGAAGSGAGVGLGGAGLSAKELRKVAFERAETAWWDCREEITAEEEMQEEAGIGEVVNIAVRDDANAAGGGGVTGSRRR